MITAEVGIRAYRQALQITTSCLTFVTYNQRGNKSCDRGQWQFSTTVLGWRSTLFWLLHLFCDDNYNIIYVSVYHLEKAYICISAYACETWMMNKTDTEKLLSFEMYCYRRILNVSCMMNVTNVEARNRLNFTENIMQSIIRRKLGLFGHSCRIDDGMQKDKSVMTRVTEEAGRRGRPRREDTEDWC
jgi:hypothetical protein